MLTNNVSHEVKKFLVPYAYLEGSSEVEVSIADLRNFVSSTDCAIMLTLIRRELVKAQKISEALLIIDCIASALGEIEVSAYEIAKVESCCGYRRSSQLDGLLYAANSANYEILNINV